MDYSHLLMEDESVLHECRQSKKVFFMPLWILLVWMSVMLLVVAINDIEKFFVALFVCAIIFGVLYLMFSWVYKNTLYVLTDKKIIVRHGLIGFSFRSIPLESITTMDISVGILDRILGGTTGTICFANDSNLSFSILGIKIGYNVFAHIDNPTDLIKTICNMIETNKKKVKVA